MTGSCEPAGHRLPEAALHEQTESVSRLPHVGIPLFQKIECLQGQGLDAGIDCVNLDSCTYTWIHISPEMSFRMENGKHIILANASRGLVIVICYEVYPSHFNLSLRHHSPISFREYPSELSLGGMACVAPQRLTQGQWDRCYRNGRILVFHSAPCVITYGINLLSQCKHLFPGVESRAPSRRQKMDRRHAM